MFGKKKNVVKTLPDDFFERVFDLELQLAKEFDIKVLQELTKLFKNAIEYYESIEDPKFIDYQNRLNMLLTRKDVLKYINKDRNKRPNSFTVNKRLAKQNYIVNINVAENHKKVKDCLKQTDSLNRSRDLIEDDINKQENTFKQRLEEKRKQKLSSSFIFENNSNNIVTTPRLKNIFNDDNFSQNADFIDDMIICQALGTPKGFGQQEKFFDNLDNNTSELLDTSKLSTRREFNFKYHGFIDELRDRIGGFLEKFNDYFNEKIFQEYTATVEKLMDEKYKKYMEISSYYDGQIKEMEFLMKDSDDQHKPSINEIINNMKIEMDLSLQKNEETHKILIQDTYDKFHKLGFKDNIGVKSIERTFEVEIFNMVHNILASS